MEEDVENLGGGSGGADCSEETKGDQTKKADGTYSITANQVALTSWKTIPPNADNSSRIMLLAHGGLSSGFIDDGTVDIRGCKGVRITAGRLALPLVAPIMSAASTNGVEIEVEVAQSITIKRGMPPLCQYITLTPTGITINAGMAGTLTLKAGNSQITMDATGITIIGVPFVYINPGAPAPPLPPLPPDEPVPPTPVPPPSAG